MRGLSQSELRCWASGVEHGTQEEFFTVFRGFGRTSDRLPDPRERLVCTRGPWGVDACIGVAVKSRGRSGICQIVTFAGWLR